MARKDPLNNCRFRVEIDGIQTASFSEVTIGATATDVIDYREGTDPTHVRKLMGLTKYGNIMLKRGFTTSMDLYNWYKQIRQGQLRGNRKNVLIIVSDEAGADEVRFAVSEAWPVKYYGSDLNAKGDEVFIETLELANEGIERIS
jgi:phage tail-like protein